MRRHVREILRQLEDMGIDSPIVTQNSHVKVRFSPQIPFGGSAANSASAAA
jgi:hypothetical protein